MQSNKSFHRTIKAHFLLWIKSLCSNLWTMSPGKSFNTSQIPSIITFQRANANNLKILTFCLCCRYGITEVRESLWLWQIKYGWSVVRVRQLKHLVHVKKWLWLCWLDKSQTFIYFNTESWLWTQIMRCQSSNLNNIPGDSELEFIDERATHHYQYLLQGYTNCRYNSNTNNKVLFSLSYPAKQRICIKTNSVSPFTRTWNTGLSWIFALV